MQKKTIEEINEIYDLELDKIIKNIKNNKSKQVLLQFPEGMKPYSTTIVEYLEWQKEIKNVQFFIWMGSCFGACDVPLEVERLGVDLILQFGHSAWKFDDKKIKVI
ncbi:MAG: diphthamide synthesis protein [Nanoarchaeota archaeon]